MCGSVHHWLFCRLNNVSGTQFSLQLGKECTFSSFEIPVWTVFLVMVCSTFLTLTLTVRTFHCAALFSVKCNQVLNMILTLIQVHFTGIQKPQLLMWLQYNWRWIVVSWITPTVIIELLALICIQQIQILTADVWPCNLTNVFLFSHIPSTQTWGWSHETVLFNSFWFLTSSHLQINIIHAFETNVK
jgi:hypothetical protein